MKLGLLTGVIGNHERAEAFAIAKQLGLDAVELGTGEFSSDWHVGLDEIVSSQSAVERLQEDLSANGLELSALSCHCNALHPNPAYAGRAQEVFRKTVLAAERLGVEQICLFAGCPGTPDGSEYPNWVSTGWPTYFNELLEWQWSEKIIPFWKEHAHFAGEHNVRLAFEMHPGDCVFNLETLLHLRDACGVNIGANFDPSHLWWQLSDPLVIARELGERGILYHVHAKDTYIDLARTARDGVLATTGMEDPNRSWRFTTVGYGHDATFWKQLVSTLRLVGYEGVLSIEHEDPLAPVMEGLERTISLLRDALWSESSASLSWLIDPPTLSALEQAASAETDQLGVGQLIEDLANASQEKRVDVNISIEGQEGVDWSDWLGLAEACEAARVNGLFSSDHYLSETEPAGRHAFDAWSVLAALASVTSRLRLGTLVSPVTFRHPAVLAKIAVTVDHISQGRVEVGFGTGWYSAEHIAYGFAFPERHERVQFLEEQLEIVRKLTDPGAASHHGRHYGLTDCPGLPKPFRGRLPIIVGGTGKRGTMECAARHADEYNVYDVSLERCRRVRSALDEACLSSGRDPTDVSLSLSLTCVIGERSSDVNRRLQRAHTLRGTPALIRPSVDEGWLVGTPDAIVGQLADVGDAGVNRVFLGLADHRDMEQIALLGSDVIARVSS